MYNHLFYISIYILFRNIIFYLYALVLFIDIRFIYKHATNYIHALYLYTCVIFIDMCSIYRHPFYLKVSEELAEQVEVSNRLKVEAELREVANKEKDSSKVSGLFTSSAVFQNPDWLMEKLRLSTEFCRLPNQFYFKIYTDGIRGYLTH